MVLRGSRGNCYIGVDIKNHFSRDLYQEIIGATYENCGEQIIFFNFCLSGVEPTAGDDLSKFLLRPNDALVPAAVYLGMKVTIDGTGRIAYKSRIAKANASFMAMKKSVYCNRKLNLKTRVSLYTAMVRGSLLHGISQISLTKAATTALNVFDRQCLRLMCNGWTHTVDGWRRKPSDWLYSITHVKPLCVCIADRRLRWLGHVGRMDQGRLPRRALETVVDPPRSWKRPKGRPRITWLRNVQLDVSNRVNAPLFGSEYRPYSFWRWVKVKASDRDAWRNDVVHKNPT
jgi:hypothetical protein